MKDELKDQLEELYDDVSIASIQTHNERQKVTFWFTPEQ